MKFEILVLKSPELSGVPDEIQIVPLGVFTDAYGRKFRIAEEDVLAILANGQTKVSAIVVDYEHQTLTGNEAPAAAWIKALVNKGSDGLWAIVEWTERAKKYLVNREYRYLSPVLLANRKDDDGLYRPEILHSAALTNTPQIDGMVPIINSWNKHTPDHCKDTEHRVPTGDSGVGTESGKEERPMKKLLEILGLKPEATEDEAVLALTALKSKAEKPEIRQVMPKEVAEALGLKEGASLSEVTGTILALKQPGNVVSMQEFQALKRRLAEKERDEQVALAMKEGKITGAQKEWADEYAMRDIEGFKVFCAKAPVVVPMGKIPAGEPKGDGALDESTLLVAKMFGNKPEDIKKQLSNYKVAV